MTTMRQTYEALLRNDLWLTRRERILARDGHCCVNCTSTLGLVVHHRQYHVDKVTGEYLMPWEYDDRYLVTLCSRCHELGHRRFKILTFKK
jgi:5-methylcytosine-specific restriction endonuclease McrA